MNNKDFSWNMHDQTERPGQALPRDTHEIIKHRYFKVLPLIENKDVLEIGAGHGIGSKLLDRNAKSYIAGEYSEENVKYLKENRENINSIQLDAHNIPFEENSFDVVIALAMIYYLDIDKFLREVTRVLRPGGKLFFCTSNKEIPGFVPSPYTTKYFTVPELNMALENHNFRAEFTGAFEAPGGSIIKRRARAIIKNIAKFIIQALPGGHSMWLKMRSQSQGEKFPLPESVVDISFEFKGDTKQLDPAKIDKKYRIIYCTATLL